MTCGVLIVAGVLAPATEAADMLCILVVCAGLAQPWQACWCVWLYRHVCRSLRPQYCVPLAAAMHSRWHAPAVDAHVRDGCVRRGSHCCNIDMGLRATHAADVVVWQIAVLAAVLLLTQLSQKHGLWSECSWCGSSHLESAYAARTLPRVGFNHLNSKCSGFIAVLFKSAIRASTE